MPDTITSIEQLEALYGQPVERALTKEIDHISDHYRVFVEKAPFVVIASVGPEGLDCSPRGDQAGFVRVVDRKTVLMPDRRGNNRTDTLHNLVRDPRVSLLFLIPGVGETLRINGTAELLLDDDLCQSFAINDKAPRCVIRVTVDRVYYQCQKALVRSKLWDAEAQVDRSELPTSGEMQKALATGEFDSEQYDRDYPERLKRELW